MRREGAGFGLGEDKGSRVWLGGGEGGAGLMYRGRDDAPTQGE